MKPALKVGASGFQGMYSRGPSAIYNNPLGEDEDEDRKFDEEWGGIPQDHMMTSQYNLMLHQVQAQGQFKKRKVVHEPRLHPNGKIYAKPNFSYSCLIGLALKNSKSGILPVS